MYDKIVNFVKNKIKRLLSKIKDAYKAFLQVVLKKEILPEAVYIEPTNICNANCIFCAYQYYDAPKEVMKIEMLEMILKEMKEMKIKKIDLTPFAGEIFTDKSIMDKLELIEKYNFESVSTYTNLLNLHKINIDKLLSCGLTNINISTSPLSKELYKKIYRSSQYDKFLNNLVSFLNNFNNKQDKKVKEIRIEFRSNMPLEQCLELPDYKNKIAPLVHGNIQVGAMQVFDSWMGVIKKDDLLEGMTIAKPNGKKLIPCGRLNHIQVLSNGDMRVCGCRFNNESEKDIFYIGNIKNISIKDAYNSQIVKDIKRSFILRNPPVECQKCSWYS